MTSDYSNVRFVLDGQVHQPQGERRTSTVLEFLRDKLHRTGTKEGCAEGDCGACVVLVGDLGADGQHIDWKPVNACMQMLPTLHGKALMTVESLQRPDGSLHPAQQAMIDSHGTQCGFCTPGFVMTMAALAQHHGQPTRREVNDALAGNLCRCTGYRPIVDAALQACAAPAERRSLQDARTLTLLKEINRSAQPVPSRDAAVVPKPLVRTRKGSEFLAPTTAAEVAACLAAHPDAVLLAGSTEFGLAVNKRHERPAFIIYLGGVAELRRVDETAADWRIGAAVPLDRVLALVAPDLPDFAEVLRRFGSPPIRATATLGGNIANGSPIGDSMPCLIALGATLVLRRRGERGSDEQRRVPLEAFYTGLHANVLQPGEFIEAIELPRPGAASPPRHFRAHKISKRFEQDISATCAALSWTLQDGVLRDVRLAYNGLSPYPARAPKIEAVLEGKAPADVTAEELDAAIAGSFTHRDGLRATWAYRSLIARNLVLNFVQPAAHTEPA